MRIILNLGSQLAIITAFIWFMPILLIFKAFLIKLCKKGHSLDEFERSFYFNTFIRFYLESFLEINTSAYINLQALDFSDGLNFFCSIVSVALVFVSLLFPIANGYFLYQNRSKIEGSKCDPHLKETYGALFEEYRWEKGWLQYMQVSFFVVRRLAFIIILVYLPVNPYVQLIAF